MRELIDLIKIAEARGLSVFAGIEGGDTLH